jgi:hypothetical protein
MLFGPDRRAKKASKMSLKKKLGWTLKKPAGLHELATSDQKKVLFYQSSQFNILFLDRNRHQ